MDNHSQKPSAILPLHTTQSAAHQLRVPPLTMSSWRATGRGPSFVKIGRLVRYRQEDLDAFIEAGRQHGDQA